MVTVLQNYLNGFKVIASTQSAPIAGIANPTEKNIFGLQFHPEVTHTKQGKQILATLCNEYLWLCSDWTAMQI